MKFLTIALLLLSVNVAAAQTGRSNNARRSSRRTSNANRPTAIVIAKSASFRQKPNQSSKLIFEVKKGAKFAVVSDAPTNGWFLVSVLGGNVKGWIDGNSIEIKQPLDDDNPPKLSETGIKKYDAAYKDDWLEYATSQGSRFYYNPAKMWREKRLVSIWLQQRNSESFELQSTILQQFDCANSRVRSLAGVNYTNGKHTYTWDEPDTPFQYVIPSTIAETLMGEVCKYAN